MSLFGWFRRPKKRERIVVDDSGVVRHMINGDTESVLWSEIQQVTVITTDEGPWLEDVFFMLMVDESSGCCVPQMAEGAKAVVDRILKLPGFNEAMFREAMGCTSNRRFVCWVRP